MLSQLSAHGTQIDDDRGRRPASDHDHQLVSVNDQDHSNAKGSNGEYTDGHRWKKAVIAFTMLKAKVPQTPMLGHFDPERRPVIVVYASK